MISITPAELAYFRAVCNYLLDKDDCPALSSGMHFMLDDICKRNMESIYAEEQSKDES